MTLFCCAFYRQSIPDTEPPVSVAAHQTHMPTTPIPVSPHAVPPGSPATQPPTQNTQMGPTVLTSDQLGKLQSELDVVQGNMVVLSEMLSELSPGKEHPSDLELLQVSLTVVCTFPLGIDMLNCLLLCMCVYIYSKLSI